jgi:VWFA-related protein
MNGPHGRRVVVWAAAALALTLPALPAVLTGRQSAADPQQKRTVFGSGVDLVVVNATVTDPGGYFVGGLSARDFQILEDGQPQPIAGFSSDRVPVSIGIVLDLSNSMKGDKLRAAKAALSRLLEKLPDPDDEIFLYGFGDEPTLLQSWTTNRDLLRKALDRTKAGGLTALYDTTARAVNLAVSGRHRKKALVILSDGTDTTSHTEVRELRRQIRESDVLVYAIGIDASVSARSGDDRASPPGAVPWPGSSDGQRGRPPSFPPRPPGLPPGTPTAPRGPGATPPAPPRAPILGGQSSPAGGEVDAFALRELTGDSGGRTEIIRSPSDLSPTTAGIADELSRQYFLGYQGAAARDGRWHVIEVRVTKPDVRVRARTGYFAGK